jgi:uncharacterized protein
MKLRVLSIDGGGIKGVVPATILQYLENKIKDITGDSKIKISDYIDFVSGTSTGSILGAGMLTPNEKGKAKYTMEDIVNLYYSFGQTIFTNKFFRNLVTCWGILGPKYKSGPISDIFLETFDHLKMSDLLKPCLFTGYDIDKRRSNIYTNCDENKKYKNIFVKDVVRGSTCVPSFFPPAYFRDNVYIHTIVDGGVFATNPSMVTYIEVSKTRFNDAAPKLYTPDNILFISLGTGISGEKSYSYNKTKKWGKLEWVLPGLDIVMTAQAETVNYEMSKVFESYNVLDNYYRLEPKLAFASSDFTDASKTNLDNLVHDTQTFIMENKEKLDQLAHKLCDI